MSRFAGSRRWMIGVLLAVALALRVPGIFWGLPNSMHRWPYHPDESMIFLAMKNMSVDNFQFNPIDFSWPSLYLYTVMGALAVAHGAGAVQIIASEAFYQSHPEQLTMLYLVARLVTLASAMVGLIVIGYLAESLHRGSRLIAILIGAVLPGHLIMSVVASPHMLSTVLAGAAMCCGIRLSEDCRRKRYLITGILWGAAVGALYDAWILFFPLTLSHSFASKEDRRHWRWLMMCSVAVLTFFVVNPYIILAPDDFLRSYEEISKYLSKVEPSMGRFFTLLKFAVGFPIVGLGLMGVVFSFIYRRDSAEDRRALIVGAWLLVSAGMIAWTGTDFLRRVLPLVIPCIALAVYAGLRLSRAGNVALFLSALFSFWISSAYISTYTIGDTRTHSARWINDNVSPGSSIGVINWFLGPHLDISRFRCFLEGHHGFKEPIDYFVATEIELPERSARARWPDSKIIARFSFTPTAYGFSVNEDAAPEDWFYTHPTIYVLHIGGRGAP